MNRLLGVVAATLLMSFLAVEPAPARIGTPPTGCCSAPWSGLFEDVERQVDVLRSPSDYAESDVREGLEHFFQNELQRRHLTDWPGLPDPGLTVLFDAAYAVVFYTGSPASIDRLLLLHRHLEERGIAGQDHATKVVRSLLVGRRFEPARALADRLRLELIVPQVLPGEAQRAAPGVFRVADAKTLVRESAALSGVRLVIVGSPGCGFFQRAVADLSEAPPLAGWIRSHAVLLLPHLEPPDLDRLTQWNESHPAFALLIPSAADEWSWIRRWSTPGFYLLVDGTLRDHFIGWADADRVGRLRALIEAGGGVLDRPDAR